MALAAGVAGCKNSNQLFEDNNDGGWFSKPMDVFAKPDWARPNSIGRSPDLGPKGPAGADDLVSADGRCGAPPQMAQAAPVSADRPVGSMAGDLAGAPMPAGAVAVNPDAPQVMGGIALGMTECQAVQRAGQPGNVAISAGERGERSVVLTYLSGPWPGIYRFSEGRLKVVERAPASPEPPAKKKVAKQPAKKPKPAI